MQARDYLSLERNTWSGGDWIWAYPLCWISFVYGTNVLIIPEKIPYLAHPFAFCRRIAYLYVALLLGLSRNKGMF